MYQQIHNKKNQLGPGQSHFYKQGRMGGFIVHSLQQRNFEQVSQTFCLLNMFSVISRLNTKLSFTMFYIYVCLFSQQFNIGLKKPIQLQSKIELQKCIDTNSLSLMFFAERQVMHFAILIIQRFKVATI